MKENENKKSVVRVTEGNPASTADVLQDGTQNKAEKLKKPLIFGLMAVVFLGCMYLIFKPSEDKKAIEKMIAEIAEICKVSDRAERKIPSSEFVFLSWLW